jgi:hypothetical protein
MLTLSSSRSFGTARVFCCLWIFDGDLNQPINLSGAKVVRSGTMTVGTILTAANATVPITPIDISSRRSLGY